MTVTLEGLAEVVSEHRPNNVRCIEEKLRPASSASHEPARPPHFRATPRAEQRSLPPNVPAPKRVPNPEPELPRNR